VISVLEATKNQGSAATPGSSVTRFYWSTNSTYDAADTPLAYRSVEPLAAGATSGPASTVMTVPMVGSGGMYYIIARADADQSVSETLENNNTRATAVRILADLIVASLVGPSAAVAPGQTLSINGHHCEPRDVGDGRPDGDPLLLVDGPRAERFGCPAS